MPILDSGEDLRPVDLFEMLDVAIGLLSEAGLRAIAKGQVPLARIMDDGRPKPSLLEVIRAFEILAGMVERIDDGEELLFFADDCGSWLFGEDWEEILPAWFRSASATVGPDAFAERVRSVVVAHGAYMRPKVLAMARKAANPDQRRVLGALVAREGWGGGAKTVRKG
jgi:hypothetical protein